MVKNCFKVTAKVKDWRSLLKVMNSITDEGTIEINKEKLMMRLVDPAHVQMVYITCYPGFFEEYNISKTDEIGMDHNWLKYALQGFSPNDKVSLRHTSDNTCWFESILKYGTYGKRFFQIDTAGIPSPKYPKIDLFREIQVHPMHFRKAVMKMTLSDHCRLTSDGTILNIYDEGDIEFDFEKKPTEDFDLYPLNPMKKKGKTAVSNYSLDYLQSIVNCVPKKVDNLTLRLGNDNPVELKYSYKKEGDIVFDASFMLAPRIE